MKKIVVVSKKYNDKNGNRKFLFSVYDNQGYCINDQYDYRKTKTAFTTYKSTFIQDFTNDNFLIIDLTE